jgi:hypothetical protein
MAYGLAKKFLEQHGTPALDCSVVRRDHLHSIAERLDGSAVAVRGERCKATLGDLSD